MSEVTVLGLRELQGAFGKADRDVRKNLREELVRVAAPVRARAENKASENISNIGSRWGRMRIGVTPGVVYVAPQSHRHGGSPRPNLAPLLLNKAMQPALDESEDEVVRGIEQMIDNVADFTGF